MVAENNSQYKPGRKKLKMTAKEKQKLLNTLTKEMQAASRALEFEKAAELRDVIFELQNEKNSKKKNTPSQTA
jgi:excinuclease ABC subunit B